MASPLSPGIGAVFNAALLREIGAHVDGEIFGLYLAHQQEEECYLFLEPASRASTSLKPNASCRTTSLGKLPQEEGWGAHGGGGAGKVLTCLAEPGGTEIPHNVGGAGPCVSWACPGGGRVTVPLPPGLASL